MFVIHFAYILFLSPIITDNNELHVIYARPIEVFH